MPNKLHPIAMVLTNNMVPFEQLRSANIEALTNFSALPDDAHVRLPVVMALCACSAATVWRYSKNGTLPTPVRLSSRVTTWNVGQLRAALRSFSSNATGGHNA